MTISSASALASVKTLISETVEVGLSSCLMSSSIRAMLCSEADTIRLLARASGVMRMSERTPDCNSRSPALSVTRNFNTADFTLLNCSSTWPTFSPCKAPCPPPPPPELDVGGAITL